MCKFDACFIFYLGMSLQIGDIGVRYRPFVGVCLKYNFCGSGVSHRRILFCKSGLENLNCRGVFYREQKFVLQSWLVLVLSCFVGEIFKWDEKSVGR